MPVWLGTILVSEDRDGAQPVVEMLIVRSKLFWTWIVLAAIAGLWTLLGLAALMVLPGVASLIVLAIGFIFFLNLGVGVRNGLADRCRILCVADELRTRLSASAAG